MRESPALKILRLVAKRGGDISYHDPFVPELHSHGLKSVDLDHALATCDLAVIVTAHPGVDHDNVARTAPLTLDLRGVTRRLEDARVTQL
jgi:UDP-N-acetyl-D-glucosamine dehydrogenase